MINQAIKMKTSPIKQNSLQSFLVKTILLSIVLFIIQACNPVKQVLKNKSKFDIVAEEVIRRGYCVNDTVVETVVDTLYQSDSSIVNTISAYKEIDTIFTDGSTLRIDSAGNLSFGCPVKIQYKTITKTETVRDRSLETILKRDIELADSTNSYLKLSIQEKENTIKAVENKLYKRQLQLTGIILALLAVVGFKLYTRFKSILPF